MIMDINSPSNAELIEAALKEENAINLYPEEKKQKTYSETLFEAYDNYYGKIDEAAKKNKAHATFLENVKSELLALGLFHEFVEPVLENFMATSHEKEIGYQTVSNFVNEQGADSLIKDFKYKNVYLAEIAFAASKTFESIKEAVDEKIKEGLPEEDIYEIENGEIEDYLLGLDDKIPHDITGVITKRVQNAIDDFVDDKKKSQFEIKQIYQQAKQKVEEYNQAQAEMINNQTDTVNPGIDPDVTANADLNTKLDAQNQQEIENAKPTIEQEAMAWANSQISKLLESNYNVFDAMTRIIVENVHKIPSLQEYYQVDSKIDAHKIMHDTRAMYTFLEACNTLNIITVDEGYITKMLKDMQH